MLCEQGPLCMRLCQRRERAWERKTPKEPRTRKKQLLQEQRGAAMACSMPAAYRMDSATSCIRKVNPGGEGVAQGGG